MADHRFGQLDPEESFAMGVSHPEYDQYLDAVAEFEDDADPTGGYEHDPFDEPDDDGDWDYPYWGIGEDWAESEGFEDYDIYG